MIAKTRQFFEEVRVELLKAQWPWDPKERGFKKYRELTDSTAVVFIALLLLGGFVAFWDLILSTVVGLITGVPSHK